MPYIDADYYKNEFEGVEIDETEIDRYIKRASDVIDQVTGYKIKDFDNLPEFIQEQVKKATASQVEFFALQGGPEVATSNDDVQSATIGSFSYTKGQSGGSSGGGQANKVSSSVIDYLKPTGLLYTGIGVVQNAYY